MVSTKTSYKTNNHKFLAIDKAFKTWSNDLEDCKKKILVFIDDNKLHCFMNKNNLSSKQVWWAQKLFLYYFWIHYYKCIANRAADTLSQYLQWNVKEKTSF